MSKAYIDVREIHPVYVNGVTAYTLENMPRDISVRNAEVALHMAGLIELPEELSAYEQDLMDHADQFVHDPRLSEAIS